MQWDDGPSAGFSRAADAWLPLAPDSPTVNVARQAGDPASLLSFYRQVIWYRKASPALLEGTYRALESPSDTFVYVREHARQRLLVALNFAGEARTIPLPADARGSVVLATAPEPRAGVAGSISLPATAGAVVEVRS
jgi:alpha-glucosidase